jgi:PhnB protein
MDFYKKVFDTKEGEIYQFPGKTGENETNITVGNVNLRLIDENSGYSCFPPHKGEVDSIWLQIIVDDLESTLQKAEDNGVVVEQESSEFMGTKNVEIFGYTWTINQIVRKVTFEERYKIYEETIKGDEIKNRIKIMVVRPYFV